MYLHSGEYRSCLNSITPLTANQQCLEAGKQVFFNGQFYLMHFLNGEYIFWIRRPRMYTSFQLSHKALLMQHVTCPSTLKLSHYKGKLAFSLICCTMALGDLHTSIPNTLDLHLYSNLTNISSSSESKTVLAYQFNLPFIGLSRAR